MTVQLDSDQNGCKGSPGNLGPWRPAPIRCSDFSAPYSWGEERLAPFWDDVVAKAEEALQAKPKFSHYMGALILAPGGDGFIIGVTPRVQVIDGQQRLTTFQLFLAALREVGHRIGVPDIDSLVHSYLHVPRMSGDTKPDATFRLIPTPEDRQSSILSSGRVWTGFAMHIPSSSIRTPS